jgi:transcriptional regulator with XRE-family HTH domain
MKTPALDNLRNRLRFRRKNLKLTFQAINEETGIAKNSLLRFLRGSGLKPDSALILGRWLGMTADEVFGQQTAERAHGTLETIRQQILSDESISEESREDLWRWFEMTYVAFTKTGK